jgi:hypothetical protein
MPTVDVELVGDEAVRPSASPPSNAPSRPALDLADRISRVTVRADDRLSAG